MKLVAITLKNIPLLALISILFSHCNNQDPYEGIPNVYVNFDLNLNLPQYADLNHPGGYVLINNEGYHGIIIYHNLNDEFIALERTCTYQPQNPCSVIYVDSSGIMLRCGLKDGDCCDSRFDMEGQVLQGPATWPLKRYLVSRNGDILNISSAY